MSTQADNFAPPLGLRNAHVQSILGSLPWRANQLLKRYPRLHAARSEIITTPQGVRLQSWHSQAHDNQAARAVVILLHGWEGHAGSNYMLASSGALLEAGFDVVRLEFRDHGRSHGLNSEFFHSCRIQEVVDAVRILMTGEQRPAGLVGFSLGGNFALRVARALSHGREYLHKVLAVSPVISPSRTLDAMEQGGFYERYFIRKWKRSLRFKQQLFPERYELTQVMRETSLRAMTASLATRYGGFDKLESYLDGYDISGERLAGIAFDTSIVTAIDDPIIPVSDFYKLEPGPNVQREYLARGGHCAFLESWQLTSWLERDLPARFAALL